MTGITNDYTRPRVRSARMILAGIFLERTPSSRTVDKVEMRSGKLMRIRLGTQPAHWLSPEDRVVGQPKRRPTFGQSAG
jgi:hypothetical protein